MPPSPVVIAFTGCRLKIFKSASVPTGPALVGAAERMAGIGDQRQAVALRQCAQRIVVARLAGVIDGDDGSRASRYLRFDSAGIDQQ